MIASGMLILGWLCLGACQSPPSPTEKKTEPKEAWKIPSAKTCSPQERPIVEILQSYNDDVLSGFKGEKLWDEELCYFPQAWSEKEKDEKRETLEKLPVTRFEWAWIEFDADKEFARVRTRYVYPAQRFEPFDGISICRRFKEGWKLFCSLPRAIQRSQPGWGQIYMEQAMEGVTRRFSKYNVGLPVPEWATAETCMRMYRQSLKECKKQNKFPISNMLSLLLSEDLELRKTAYVTLKDVFRVDFGYSEEKADMSHWDKSTQWRDPWIRWAVKTFGGRDDEVSWPEQ